MPGTVSVEDVMRGVEELRLLQAPRRIESGGLASLEGEVSVEGQSVTLRIELGSGFPLELPRFYLSPWNALGFIPHVAMDWLICFADPEGLVVDRRRPVDVVADGFELAMSVMADGVSGRNVGDFVDEFEWYWERYWERYREKFSEGEVALSVLDPGGKVDPVIVAVHKEKGPWVAGSESDIRSFLNGQPLEVGFRFHDGLYLPLEVGTIITPPCPLN